MLTKAGATPPVQEELRKEKTAEKGNSKKKSAPQKPEDGKRL
jgi:hypothetical protein